MCEIKIKYVKYYFYKPTLGRLSHLIFSSERCGLRCSPGKPALKLYSQDRLEDHQIVPTRQEIQIQEADYILSSSASEISNQNAACIRT